MTGAAAVFVVDDDASVRQGLSRLLRSAGYEVRTFDSAAAFCACAPSEALGCLVLDLSMPNVNGLQLQDRLKDWGYDIPVIFLSGHGDVPVSVQAMKRGAIDFLTKPVDEKVLLAALDTAISRHRELRTASAERNAVRQRANTLSPRELETMQCVIAGLLNKQAADRLGIAEKTVKVHRARAMQKMNATSVAELVRLCEIAGIEPAPARD